MISIKKEINLFPLERVPLLKFLLILILVYQDEVDPPHAVVEEQGVLLVVELGLWAKTRLTGQLCCLILVDLFLHNVIHGERRERERGETVCGRTVQRNCCVRCQQSKAYLTGDVGHAGKWEESTNTMTHAHHLSLFLSFILSHHTVLMKHL